MSEDVVLVDCTLRDGGYYTRWDFSFDMISDYLQAMIDLNVDFVEIGFRSLKNEGFKGGCGFSTDEFIRSLQIPNGLQNKIGVMINASELIHYNLGVEAALERLFLPKSESPVSLVRIASHYKEFSSVLPAVGWLKNKGYIVGINVMQIADRTMEEIEELSDIASKQAIDVLYFADSMGSLTTEHVQRVIKAFRSKWAGALGIHTHDNLGLALSLSNTAVENGVTWVDGTVTGMGRGPGNAKTEYLAIELDGYRKKKQNLTKLLELIRKYFRKMHSQYCWGSNPYYFLAGKYGIHPSYIQEMLNDSRYNEEDILAVIEHLKLEGGKKFSFDILESARNFYTGNLGGAWHPKSVIAGQEVLILGSGPGVARYQKELERFIKEKSPFVIALNTQKNIEESLVNVRAACHPVRLLADCAEHMRLPQPLITPSSMLPENLMKELTGKQLFDYGLTIRPGVFEFHENYCVLPASLVMAYALAIATSGKATRILLAGFDGYDADDPRRHEIDTVFHQYNQSISCVPICAITPTLYDIPCISIYGL